MFLSKPNLLALYQDVVAKEQSINPKWAKLTLPSADDVYNITSRLDFVIKQSITPRSMARYLNAKDARHANTMVESVAAHTYLVIEMVHYALNYFYGADFAMTKDFYTLSEIIEVIIRHDLPEVTLGDQPDDQTRDEAKKLQNEALFHQDFNQFSLPQHKRWEQKVSNLLLEFNYRSSATGRLIYAADKVSAILMLLCLKQRGTTLYLKPHDRETAPLDIRATEIIDGGRSKRYFVGEAWTVSHFITRRFIDFDDTGFMTCLLIMYTLKTNGFWYPWREACYHS